ncbi:MAG TPA: TIGR04452 family lipoprotein [Leptospiraceae bacterium]|nr:TIGR04452 family lipoprotein [Leptospiraceae bacterium]HMX33070.1 TIGR04452 family lipoprotein [Leptospiraceae bacterium]HMY29810.1 TIGR04452 family lipoprotein [Leptospiraceae bacterium]HMZ67421.1 TIGR04452 family lipoprotein [Leptospiraceae bacterium]HNA06960.1 TIGR04452 family lipoprotein [Leptospiraceae bacterium]
MKNQRIPIYLFLLILTFHACPITNKFVLKPSRVKGTEAKEIIQNRLSSLFVNDISTGSNDSLVADFLIPTIAGINDTSIYSRRDVESCATKIFLGAIAIDQPNIIANRTKRASAPLLQSNPNSRLYPPILCQLKPIDDWIDLD